MSSEHLTKPVYDAEIYSIYRPNVPEEISRSIIAHLTEKFKGSLDMALDVGCGAGQSTIILAPYFKQVMGIDVSEAQIKEAQSSRTFPNITFTVGPAECFPVANDSVQLVTACAAFHWFKKEEFFTEVNRVLVPGGILAVYSYYLNHPLIQDPILMDKVDCLFNEKYEELEPYSAKEAASVAKKYADVHFPFEEVIRVPDVRQTFDSNVTEVIGYMQTISSFQTMKNKDPVKAERFISDFSERLKKILQTGKEEEQVNLKIFRDFHIIICRKGL